MANMLSGSPCEHGSYGGLNRRVSGGQEGRRCLASFSSHISVSTWVTR